MSRIGKEALPFVQDNSMLWKFTLGTPGIPDASLPPADKLSKTNLTALGAAPRSFHRLGMASARSSGWAILAPPSRNSTRNGSPAM